MLIRCLDTDPGGFKAGSGHPDPEVDGKMISASATNPKIAHRKTPN